MYPTSKPYLYKVPLNTVDSGRVRVLYPGHHLTRNQSVSSDRWTVHHPGGGGPGAQGINSHAASNDQTRGTEFRHL